MTKAKPKPKPERRSIAQERADRLHDALHAAEADATDTRALLAQAIYDRDAARQEARVFQQEAREFEQHNGRLEEAVRALLDVVDHSVPKMVHR